MSERVMVVDDSRTQLEALAEQLEAWGYAVERASSGEEALALLPGRAVALVLLDMQLPGLSGEETCRQLKADPALAATAVVMMTAREGQARALEDALDAGADDFVAKGTEPAVLLARVRAQLRRRALEQEHLAMQERLARAELAAEQVRAAEALAAQRELHLADLARKNAELTRARDALQEAVRVRDEFLSVASHELKTPLTTLRLHTEALQMGALTPERLHDKVAGIQRMSLRLVTLINSLLDVSRITSHRLRLEREDVDLGALVGRVAEQLRADVERARCPVQLALAPGVVGRWDAARLEQVVQNLLANALKYGPGRPVHVVLERVDGAPARARLTVRDEGIGIAPEDQARIFERFERAVSVRHYGGFGLGLWISRTVVEALGGTIRVTSAPGKGSTFVVELPLDGGEGVAA